MASITVNPTCLEVAVQPSIAVALPRLAIALTAVSALSLAAGAATLVGSILELNRLQSPWLRIGALLLSAAMTLLTALDGTHAWPLTLSCVAFLLVLEAVAIEFARVPSLRDYAQDAPDGDEPHWWDDFENAFWRAVASNHTEAPGDKR